MVLHGIQEFGARLFHQLRREVAVDRREFLASGVKLACRDTHDHRSRSQFHINSTDMILAIGPMKVSS